MCGFNGAYGYRGGYRGGYGGWYGRFGYGGWGGLGYGLYLSTLPYYYSTYWWDGVPYYYADDDYYVWDNSVDQYQAVSPPPEVLSQRNTQQTLTDLFAYPKNGQSPEQQLRDKQACRDWAAAQTGPAPTQSDTAPGAARAGAAAPAGTREGYLRAEAACFEARGYSVK
jgi:hypothetical protein